MKRAFPLLLLIGGVASAQSLGDMAELFPAKPCHDGWAGCLVAGQEVNAEPLQDSAGRPMPSSLRVAWFDLDPTVTFDPFAELSAYTGELPEAEPASTEEDDAMAALLDGEVPTEDDGEDPDPEPVDADPETQDDDEDRERASAFVESSDLSTERTPPPTEDDFDNDPAPFGDAPVVDDRLLRDPVVTEVEPDPEPDPDPEPQPDPELPDPDPEEVVMLEDPTFLGGEVSCESLVAMEPTALMGKLNPTQVECLEARISTSPTMTDKDKTSRVLLANAEANGNKNEWERLMRRHLEEIDRSDPNLCFKYALHLSRGGVGRAWGVIKWSDYALENKSQWSGATYKSRVYSLYQLKAEASNRLWEDANDKLVNAQGGEREELAAKEEKLRGMSKDSAMEWLDYARASNQDTKKPMQLCVAAAGSKKYCQE